MAQKPALGKGLASLLPGASSVGQVPNPQVVANTLGALMQPSPQQPTSTIGNHERHLGITMLQIEDIEVNDYQPRRSFDDETLAELSQSIKTSGIIQPLVVRKTSDGYQLIAGERRLRASKLAGLKQVPVVIRRSTDKEALELALIENIQRENLNCVDEALAYQQLMDEFQLTQEEVAVRVGKERATVANYLRLLRLPEAIVDDLKKQVLSFGHGKAILMIEDSDARLELRRKIVENRLSVRQAEAEAQVLRMRAGSSTESPGQAGQSAAITADPVQQRLQTLSQELTRIWSAKVQFQGNRKKGKVTIHYSDSEQLERIVAAMQNSKSWENPRV